MRATVRIERFADQGRCVAHIDGRVVFVRFALPGELAQIELDEPHDREWRFWTAEVVDVLEASPDRCEPAWPLAGPLSSGGGVGGADLVHVTRSGQLRWKAAVVSEQMRRLGHVDRSEVDVVAMPGDDGRGGLHWRTRMELVADDGGRASMRRRGTHERLAIDTMPLATESVLAAADAAGIWDGGYEPGATIRVVSPARRETADDGDTSSVRARDAVLIDGKLVAGSEPIHEKVRVAGRVFRYEVAANGFWQVHREAPAVFASHVRGLALDALQGRDDAVVWDLYSGSGLFTLPLALTVGSHTRVLSVEGSKTAVKSARRNIRHAGADEVDIRCGDVAKVLSGLSGDRRSPDVVVLDPPRAGAGARVCRILADHGATSIIYVSCDPASLARDTATLRTLGYELSSLRAFDAYPMTHHVETIASFVAVPRP
ncbi:SAM-dependent methyltransferase [Bifidobacterium minimum]|uniref:SAM-dependent methyltransferase n=1 Tax=Bifidobacterium minimum TaxID=1693 RepID=A0A087BQ43_9BIFI|nr:TRAM domain-containing protein [Bifidobacterium minimum]KFI73143.1 SAM-dependent methyltransferase [Bifidobacterium minimum]